MVADAAAAAVDSAETRPEALPDAEASSGSADQDHVAEREAERGLVLLDVQPACSESSTEVQPISPTVVDATGVERQQQTHVVADAAATANDSAESGRAEAEAEVEELDFEVLSIFYQVYEPAYATRTKIGKVFSAYKKKARKKGLAAPGTHSCSCALLRLASMTAVPLQFLCALHPQTRTSRYIGGAL